MDGQMDVVLAGRMSVHSTRQSHSRSKEDNGSRSDPAAPWRYILFSPPPFARVGPWRGTRAVSTTITPLRCFKYPEPFVYDGARSSMERPATLFGYKSADNGDTPASNQVPPSNILCSKRSNHCRVQWDLNLGG